MLDLENNQKTRFNDIGRGKIQSGLISLDNSIALLSEGDAWGGWFQICDVKTGQRLEVSNRSRRNSQGVNVELLQEAPRLFSVSVDGAQVILAVDEDLWHY